MSLRTLAHTEAVLDGVGGIAQALLCLLEHALALRPGSGDGVRCGL